MIEKWKIYEAEFEGTSEGNPFTDVTLTASFTNGSDTIRVNGFYCGDGHYRVRLMPTAEGVWTGVTASNDPALDKKEMNFEVGPASKKNHGRVLRKTDVVPQTHPLNWPNEDLYHFSYEDGTRFQPFGTTCYAWINQPEEIQEETLNSLAASPFNKVRMCIFPKYYTYNTTNPEMYAFEGEEGNFDFARFNPKFWDHLEKRIAELDELGIQADIILLHPYDKWGFSKMGRETDVFYLKYAVDRLSHFKNVWWSMANEFDLMPWKTIDDWELYARVVMGRDPYGHLRSIHNCVTMYDQTRPWITHVSVQRIDVYKTAEKVTDWRELYQKPIVVDECAYEGNMNFGWGNITGEEMTRRFWEGCIRGGYLSHGETYVDQGPQIWWAHGGKLHGTSPDRIRFLKAIMAEVPDGAAPVKLTPENNEEYWDCPCLRKGDEYMLYYFGFFRPAFRTYSLPKGRSYRVELIDTWNMTIETLPGTYSGDIRLDMPSRQYMAFRFTAV